MVGNSQLDLQQVQADEIKVKTQRGTIWMAMAMMISTRLPSLAQCRAHCIGIDWTRWLGGVISAKRDKGLIRVLAEQIRAVALCRPLLLAVDGLPSYVDAFRKTFRSRLPHRTGEQGRLRLIAWPNIATKYCRTVGCRLHSVPGKCRTGRQTTCGRQADYRPAQRVLPRLSRATAS